MFSLFGKYGLRDRRQVLATVVACLFVRLSCVRKTPLPTGRMPDGVVRE